MPPTQERIAEFNSDIEAETVEVAEDSRDLERSEDVVVGDDILRIPQSTIQNYNLHFPFRRGDLNLHSDVGGSLTSILVGQSRCRCVSSVLSNNFLRQICRKFGVEVSRLTWVFSPTT